MKGQELFEGLLDWEAEELKGKSLKNWKLKGARIIEGMLDWETEKLKGKSLEN